MANFIFITGTGRSGTHLVGRTIGSHPEIEKRIEDPKTFGLITHLANTRFINSGWKNFYYQQRMLSSLNKVVRYSNKPWVLEKSHPSIWLTDILEKNYSTAKFVGVWREAEPTIASMLRHNGVLSWFKILPDNKVNPFLGITPENVSYYKNLSLIEKCYLRWKSHLDKLQEIEKTLGSKFMSIKYDDFVTDTNKFNAEIANFIGIENQFSTEPIKIESLDKWKTQLTDEQKNLIAQCRERFH